MRQKEYNVKIYLRVHLNNSHDFRKSDRGGGGGRFAFPLALITSSVNPFNKPARAEETSVSSYTRVVSYRANPPVSIC